MNKNLALLDKEDLRQVLREVIEEMHTLASQHIPNPQQTELLLTREEAAKALDVSLVTLAQWVKDGRIPKPKKIGKRVYFLRDQFKEFLNSKD
jgi:excisionase family DNA binding protein